VKNKLFTTFAILNLLKKENMKKLAFVSLLALILVSATNLNAQDELKAKAAVSETVSVVTPEKFQDFAAENVGKEVELEGMVIHVCKHGGKKMFLIGEDPEMRVKITASEKVGEFKPELEGSTVHVMGVIEPIEEEVVPDDEKANQDADHSNYYHKPQYAISCLKFKTID
jgi:RecJ-like exonuclease